MKRYLAILSIVMFILVISIPLGMSYGEEDKKIPDWIKGIFQYYLNDKITDTEMIQILEFLISDGIIEIEEKQYEPFSKENFPQTGGFDPAWLDGEKSEILEVCLESSKVGFENSYCKYVQ